jgi:hypothetical protein
MFTRDSLAREIADTILYEGQIRSHTEIDCNAKRSIIDFLDQNQSIVTLGDWLDAVRFFGHHHSEHTMGFILTHDYLMAMFPADLEAEFWELCHRNVAAAAYLRYVFDGNMPVEYENEIPQLTAIARAMFDEDDHWGNLVGTQ